MKLFVAGAGSMQTSTSDGSARSGVLWQLAAAKKGAQASVISTKGFMVDFLSVPQDSDAIIFQLRLKRGPAAGVSMRLQSGHDRREQQQRADEPPGRREDDAAEKLRHASTGGASERSRTSASFAAFRLA